MLICENIKGLMPLIKREKHIVLNRTIGKMNMKFEHE